MTSTPSTQPPADTRPAAGPADRPRRRLTWLAVGLAPVLLVGGAVGAQAHKSVDLQIDGETRTVGTFAGSVAGVLAEQGIELGEHDLLAPGGETALADGADIVVRTARPVTVEVDGEPKVVWTTAESQDELIAGLHRSGGAVTVAASRSLDRSALDLPLVVDGEADVVADGATSRVALTGEATAQDALAAAGVEVARTDRVEIGAADDGTVQVTVTRIARTERTETQPVDFATVEREDDSLYEGQTEVVQEGAAGERTLTFATITVDGQETHAVQVGDEVTTAPVDRVVAVGTQERPAPAPAPAPTRAAAPAAPSSGAVSGDVWAALAQCESGGNPRAVSANGLYYGLYQFSVSTWQSVGGSGLPSDASPAEQTQRAQALQARSGWGQWPACAAKLGLL